MRTGYVYHISECVMNAEKTNERKTEKNMSNDIYLISFNWMNMKQCSPIVLLHNFVSFVCDVFTSKSAL